MGAALLCGAVPAGAQMELGVIKGRVVDEAGKPLQGVTIRLVNVDRGREVTITTDKDGRFYRRGLQVGGYELKVEHEGYQPVSNPIKISGGIDSNFDFTLAKAARRRLEGVPGRGRRLQRPRLRRRPRPSSKRRSRRRRRWRRCTSTWRWPTSS